MCEVAVFIVMIVLCIFIGVAIGGQLAAPRIMNRLFEKLIKEEDEPEREVNGGAPGESRLCQQCKHFNDMDYCPNCNGDEWEAKE